MKVTVEDVSAVQKRLRVEIPPDVVGRELDKIYNKIRKEAQIKGFRPGKAPRSLLERHYKSHAESEAISALVGEAYPKILDEQAIRAVAEPEIESAKIEEDQTLRFDALIPVRPTFEPQGYRGIEVARRKAAVTDAQVADEIARMRDGRAQMAPVEEDRPLERGDFADIDFDGTVGGKPFQGGQSKGYLLELGSDTFVPGFEEQVIGLRRGEEKQVRVTFPENYGAKNLAGKDVVFHVKVNGIKRREVPELNDEFARGLEGAELQTLDDLRRYVRDQLMGQDEAAVGRETRQKIADRLVALNPFDLPPIMIEKQTEHVMENARQQLLYGGFPQDRIAYFLEGRRNDYRAEAERQVRFSMVLDRIAEAEGVAVTDDELAEQIARIAQMSERPIEAVTADYRKENRMEILRDRLRDEKVVDLVVKAAKLVETDATPDAPAASHEEAGS
jgi:trigger factor